MYPHERSLVKRLADKPFALLGINSDPDRAGLEKVLVDESITWRSWWDETTSGRIATEWIVSGWPTIYVLDENGVIRNRGARHEKLITVVKDLVAEMKRNRADDES